MVFRRWLTFTAVSIAMIMTAVRSVGKAVLHDIEYKPLLNFMFYFLVGFWQFTQLLFSLQKKDESHFGIIWFSWIGALHQMIHNIPFGSSMYARQDSHISIQLRCLPLYVPPLPANSMTSNSIPFSLRDREVVEPNLPDFYWLNLELSSVFH